MQTWLFGALYGPGARFYDDFTAWLFGGEWERWQRLALAELPASGLVVELGSGTGALAEIGASATRRWIGCDRSPAMLRVARPRVGALGPWFVRADAAAIPMASATVDGVVAAFPTDYALRSTTAREIQRVLKPGGVVVILLSGTLAADGIGRRARRTALRLFYGPTSSDRAVFRLEGFEGSTRKAASAHGSADLYTARKREQPLTAGG